MDIAGCLGLGHIKAWRKKTKISPANDFWKRQAKKSHDRRRIREAKVKMNIQAAELMDDYVKRMDKRGRQS